MTVEQKREIAGYIDDMGDLYKYCLETAETKLSDVDCDLYTVRACASSLFIAAQRRFDLA